MKRVRVYGRKDGSKSRKAVFDEDMFEDDREEKKGLIDARKEEAIQVVVQEIEEIREAEEVKETEEIKEKNESIHCDILNDQPLTDISLLIVNPSPTTTSRVSKMKPRENPSSYQQPFSYQQPHSNPNDSPSKPSQQPHSPTLEPTLISPSKQTKGTYGKSRTYLQVQATSVPLFKQSQDQGLGSSSDSDSPSSQSAHKKIREKSTNELQILGEQRRFQDEITYTLQGLDATSLQTRLHTLLTLLKLLFSSKFVRNVAVHDYIAKIARYLLRREEGDGGEVWRSVCMWCFGELAGDRMNAEWIASNYECEGLVRSMIGIRDVCEAVYKDKHIKRSDILDENIGKKRCEGVWRLVKRVYVHCELPKEVYVFIVDKAMAVLGTKDVCVEDLDDVLAVMETCGMSDARVNQVCLGLLVEDCGMITCKAMIVDEVVVRCMRYLDARVKAGATLVIKKEDVKTMIEKTNDHIGCIANELDDASAEKTDLGFQLSLTTLSLLTSLASSISCPIALLENIHACVKMFVRVFEGVRGDRGRVVCMALAILISQLSFAASESNVSICRINEKVVVMLRGVLGVVVDAGDALEGVFGVDVAALIEHLDDMY